MSANDTPQRKGEATKSDFTRPVGDAIPPSITPSSSAKKQSMLRNLTPISSAKKEKVEEIRRRRSSITPSKATTEQFRMQQDLVNKKTPDSRGKSVVMKERAQQLREERENVKHLFITGFGNFGDVAANPTEEIIEALNCEHFTCGEYSASYKILKVSTQAVDGYLSDRQMWNQVKGSNINIHLGVASSNMNFQLEQYCYNNKDFRIPDISGSQPQREKIVEEMQLDQALASSFDLVKIRDRLKRKGFDVGVSTDPGRYLCNYIFFQSYRQQARVLGAEIGGDYEVHSQVGTEHFGDDEDASLSAGKNKTVFIHVPPFGIIEKETQIEFIKECIELLCSEDACDRAPGSLPTRQTDKGCDTACVADVIPGCSQS